MKWCCIGFKSSYDAAGQRGTAYLIGRDSLGNPEFTLQFRAVDMDKEFPLINSDIPISMAIDMRIVFCPSCGVNLEKFYEKYVDSLNRKELKILEL